MILVYSEKGDLTEPMFCSTSDRTKAKGVAISVLGKHGFENRLPNNRIGFLVHGSDALIIIPKFMYGTRLENAKSPIGAVEANSDLMSLFTTIASFKRHLVPSAEGWKYHGTLDPACTTPLIFDIEIDLILEKLRKFLEENARNAIETVSRDVYAIRGRINFSRQIATRGSIAVPISCDYSVSSSVHPLYQFCSLFIEDLFSHLSPHFRHDSILHRGIRNNIQSIGNLLAHSPANKDPISTTELALEFLNRNEFQHWQPMIGELVAFRNRFSANGADQISYSHLVFMDKMFEDLMAEVLEDCAAVKGTLALQETSALLGGATWLSATSKKQILDTETQTQTVDQDSNYKTRPDAIFLVENQNGKKVRVISDFKYKNNMVVRDGCAITNFSRGDRYQLIAFLLSDILSGGLVDADDRKLVVFYPVAAEDSETVGMVNRPYKLQFDSAYAFEHSISRRKRFTLKSGRMEKGMPVQIYLIPVNLELIFDAAVLRDERDRISRCLGEVS